MDVWGLIHRSFGFPGNGAEFEALVKEHLFLGATKRDGNYLIIYETTPILDWIPEITMRFQLIPTKIGTEEGLFIIADCLSTDQKQIFDSIILQCSNETTRFVEETMSKDPLFDQVPSVITDESYLPIDQKRFVPEQKQQDFQTIEEMFNKGKSDLDITKIIAKSVSTVRRYRGELGLVKSKKQKMIKN